AGSPSVSPLTDPAPFEIIRIGHGGAFRLLRLRDEIRNTLLLGVGDGFFLCVETKRHLRERIRRAGPAHQRLDGPRRRRLEAQNPFFHIRGARLHGVAGGLVDPGGHWFSSLAKNPWSGRPDSKDRKSTRLNSSHVKSSYA